MRTRIYTPIAFRALALCGLFTLNGFGQAPGTIVTVAGTGTAGYNGDNITAVSAQLNAPPFVAVDVGGNIYIADEKNHRVRKVDATGKITTFAGTGTPGYNGDNIAATAAQLNGPTGVFADAAGNVYINEPGNQRIRKVNAAGIISTVAGTGAAGYNGDGIAATNASLFNAVRAVADGSGNLYIADQSNHRIRKIDTTGTITTIAGTGVIGYNGDGVGPATQLNNPTAVALDAAGNLYFSDQLNHRIRELTGGRVVTIAGTGTAGFNGDGPSLNTQLNFPGSLFVDPTSGAIYFTDGPNQRLRKISADRSQITSVAGTGTGGYNGDGIAASGAQLNFAFGVAIDSAGNIYLADTINNRIRKIISAPTTLSFVGSMPHLAAEGGWSTTFTFVNKGVTPGSAQVGLFDPNGVPLSLPVTFPQQATNTNAASVSQTIPANGSFVMQANGPPSPAPYLEGSAQLAASGNVDGYAIFHYDPNNQEAVVPMESRSASSYLLAFDNTNTILTGVAVANVSATAASIPVVIRKGDGSIIDTESLLLPANGHTSFVLSQKWGLTANVRGTVEFDTPAGSKISVLGIRYTGGTTTTIPALANVTSSGGYLAHIASGAGWQTTFYLINTGTSSAQAQMTFWADKTGNAMPLPLALLDGTNPITTALYAPIIAPGAVATIQSGGPGATSAQLLTGSAQLRVTGNISGFVIFRYNPNGQEAVVPLESRGASSYLIAFDNTAGTVTGLAIGNGSAQVINVPVTLRDDNGNLLSPGVGSLPLAANGHAYDVLTNFFPQTANLRGTIQFDAPSGAALSVLGIRSNPALTFTTLPALAK